MSDRATLLSFRRPSSYTETFEDHASLEAIQAHIEQARKRQTDIQNELGWLEGLCLRRAEDIALRYWGVSGKTINEAQVEQLLAEQTNE